MTVLLFMMLVFILITSMLSVTGNEIVIAGLQRDSVRAMDVAQGCIQEAVRRVEAGRPYNIPFPCALAPSVQVSVINHHSATGGIAAFLEFRADATVGRSTRRLSTLILAISTSFPPNITFASSVSESGSADISCGDAYAMYGLRYKNFPSNSCPEQDGVADGTPPEPPNEPQTITYAGWRTSKGPGGAVPYCYTHAECMSVGPAEADYWYPGTRQTANPGTTDHPGADGIPGNGDDRDIGTEILDWVNDPLTDLSGCPATPPSSPEKVGDTAAAGDMFATGPLANTSAVGSTEPVFGFDTDGGLAFGAGTPCGFAYQWVRRQVFNEETGVPEGFWWFKTIIFEEWLDRYWYVDYDALEYKKGGDLLSNPQYGAIPPYPDFATFTTNYDCKISGGGVLNSLPAACIDAYGNPTTSDLGTAANPKIILLEGDWTINGNIQGYGTLIINGNAVVNGTFDYWGTVMVNGTLQAGTGNVNVYGGLVAFDTLRLIGNITVEGGSTVGGTPPAGPANVLGKAWWER